MSLEAQWGSVDIYSFISSRPRVVYGVRDNDCVLNGSLGSLFPQVAPQMPSQQTEALLRGPRVVSRGPRRDSVSVGLCEEGSCLGVQYCRVTMDVLFTKADLTFGMIETEGLV